MTRLLLSLFFTLTIIAVFATGGYLFYENQHLNKIIKMNETDVSDLSYRNERLNYKLKQQDELIKHYEKMNRELTKEIRNLRYAAKNNRTYKNHKIIIKQQRSNHQNIDRKNKYVNINNYKKQKVYKRYHKYYGYEKLLSDSKIEQRSDGRFVSNSAIYGIYKDRILSAQCGGNPKLYKVVNECKTYAAYSSDLLYFAKSNIGELKTFNPRDHKIECHYNQEYGIMENCRAKVFKFIY